MTQPTDKKVRKAVIAAAGFGTRFLPQTKAMPKEMLPLVDKPIIQYIVEELADAGIEDIIIVTGYHKRSIEDHFDHMSTDLRSNLKAAGKTELLEQTKKISDLANFAYVRQKGPYGTATPLMNAAHLIGDEPFIYTFADDVIVAEPNGYSQMIKLYQELDASILPCIKLTQDDEFKRYGIVAGSEIKDGVMRADSIVEKPGRAKAPSDFGSIGAFLLKPEALDFLEAGQQRVRQDDEFYLSTYVIEPMLRDNHPFYAFTPKNSKRYDTGDKLEYVKTVVDFALMHDDLKDDFEKFLRDRMS